MAQAANLAMRAAERLFGAADTGLARELTSTAHVRGLDFQDPESARVIAQNMSPELCDKTGVPTYPLFQLYCERVSNELTEKFRTFSGTVSMAVEVRVTHDRPEALEGLLQVCVDAVTAILDRNRGHWDTGVFHSGTWEVSYQPVKRGGNNYIGSAKVRFDVQASI